MRLLPFILALALTLGSAPAQEAERRGPETSPSISGRISTLDSRGGNQVVSLGNGRGRLRVPLDQTESSVAESGVDDERLPDTNFLIDWLRDELPERFPGLESVDLVESRFRRDAGHGAVVTRRSELELRGKIESLRPAADYVDELLSLRRVRVNLAGRYLVRPRRPGERWEQQVELLDLAALQAVEDELRVGGAREFARLEFDLQDLRSRHCKRLDELRFVRRHQVEELAEGQVVVPVLGSVFEGVQGSASAFLLPGARELALALDLGLGVIVRPVPKREVELLGKRHEIMIPEVATRRFRNDRILIGPDDVALVVRGLPFPGSDGPEREAREELVLLVNVEIEPLPRRLQLGRVLGFDDQQDIAFARIAPEAEIHPGMRLAVTRNNRLVGRVEVLELLDQVMTLRPLEGHPQRHDELR